ncbi:MAG: hypothetical protein LC747_00765, partial [Acidobacteria bacterium]|nr:hypothetical protein [Acidobacteriota bacterium]
MTREPEDNPAADDAPTNQTTDPDSASLTGKQSTQPEQTAREDRGVKARFEEASTVAGESDMSVGAATAGQFPTERVVAEREREASTGKY